MTSQSGSASTETDVLPALYEHCMATYRAMLAEATTVVGEGGTQMVVYEGFLTTLITSKLNLSVPYYTTITQTLKNMNCIRQLKRGGGSAPSQWELIYEPTEDAFLGIQKPKKPRQTREDALSEQIRNLATRVSKLEETQGNVVQTLAQHFGSEEVQ